MRREWLPHCANLDKLETLKVLRDGRCVAFSKLNHTGLIDAAEALKDHSVTDRLVVERQISDAGDRIAFNGARND